jgi:uncharacterized protein (DUF2267 family)
MTYDAIAREVQRRAGLTNAEETERAIYVTLRALGERLNEAEAQALASGLPDALAMHFGQARHECDFGVDELYDRVARREGIPLGFGKEHAQSVCQILGESLELEQREQLTSHLPPDFAELFEPRPIPTPCSRPAHIDAPVGPGEGTTLATGRSGSRHPLSEARPENAQTHSVVRSDNPHADTKLSSSQGTTQERLHESLATGTPGPEHPISKTRR